MARTKQTTRNSTRLKRSAAPNVAAAAPSNTPMPSRKSSRSAPSSQVGKEKRKRRYRPGTVALMEIRRLQKTTDLLIPATAFIRLVKEISNFFNPEITRWTAEALHAIQEAAEEYLIDLFEESMLCAIHAKRVTLMKKDYELARRLGGKGQPW